MSDHPDVPVDVDLADCASRGQITAQEAAIYSTARQVTELKKSMDLLLKKTAELEIAVIGTKGKMESMSERLDDASHAPSPVNLVPNTPQVWVETRPS